MSTITKNSKNIHNPIVEYLCSDLPEVLALADELEQRLKEINKGELQKLFHKLLMQIKIQETSDVLDSESDETNQAYPHIKPTSLYSLLIDRMVESLRKERQNWTQKMWAEDMLQNMEQSQLQAIADGTAIDEDWEAAIDE
ncbi:hypothetical protein FJZ31_39155 [Candidatus Poribacteria bacterium]|nr:hypothetical protein [Candidatus Poribacteria bacterium]